MTEYRHVHILSDLVFTVNLTDAAAFPALEGIVRAAPSADFRVAGMRVSREPHRYSGRTAMSAHRTIHEPRPPQDPDSPLAFSMDADFHGGKSINVFGSP